MTVLFFGIIMKTRLKLPKRFCPNGEKAIPNTGEAGQSYLALLESGDYS
jgi:hypothetical protein